MKLGHDRRIQAILFDLDGTLIDSESVHYSCWNELLEPFGVRIDTDDYVANFQGVSIVKNAERLQSVYGIDIPVDRLISGREALYQVRLDRGEIKLMPHAEEILEACYRAGFSIGLVTSSARSETEVILKKTAFDKYFKASVTRTDVRNFKPHPEPYLIAAAAMARVPRECLVFEDTFSGITSAKAAGMVCIGVQPDPQEAVKLKGVADYFFADLGQARSFLQL